MHFTNFNKITDELAEREDIMITDLHEFRNTIFDRLVCEEENGKTYYIMYAL